MNDKIQSIKDQFQTQYKRTCNYLKNNTFINYINSNIYKPYLYSFYSKQVHPYYKEYIENKIPPKYIRDFTIASSTLLLYFAGVRLYKRGFKRIHTNNDILENDFKIQRKLKGKAIHVGDSDNFRLLHYPPLLGPYYTLFKNNKLKKKLSEETIHIRLAGIDAPECAHFGQPGQPYGEVVLAWLTKFLSNNHVTVYLLKRDQYNRAVCSVYVRKWWYYFYLKQLNLSEYMLKKGYAVCYEGEGEVYIEGSKERNSKYKEYFKRLEDKAKSAKKGMWAKKSTSESPKDYKRRMKGTTSSSTNNTASA
ncbi:hypothetical protein ABK040_000816 [Willaertia magna]